MGTRKMLTGNYAAAHGARLARIEVMPVYPITPQTPIMEKMVEFIERGDLDAEFIPVESEHSVMAAGVAAEAMGARTFTATSAQGLAYMHENLFVASSSRLPIVMAIVNRYLGPPQTIVPDHTDSLDQRDTGWIQIYVENAQEVHDMMVQAYRIGEDKRVLLPVAICYEGIIISHKMESVEILNQEEVDLFLPPYRPEHVILDTERPMALGQIAMDDSYITEIKYQQQEAMDQAESVIQQVDREFGEIFGRRYGGVISAEMMEDAEIAILTLGTMATTAREVVRQLRKEEGIPVGLVKLRSFRPFPDRELKECLSKVKAIAVLEKDVSVGAGGIVYFELCHCFNRRSDNPLLIDYILGLGGRDVTPEHIREIALNLYGERDVEHITNPIRWHQVRGLS
ncbi:MAG: transketolase C-terminal domain-containing protein [Desulfobacteraceae bacterium]|jgi:pyruvate/2-oxoacid:ferredoxin oxidoreductase alpha subunit